MRFVVTCFLLAAMCLAPSVAAGGPVADVPDPFDDLPAGPTGAVRFQSREISLDRAVSASGAGYAIGIGRKRRSLLVRSASADGVLVTLSDSAHAVVTPIALPPEATSAEQLVVADIDADGVDELVLFDRDLGRWTIAAADRDASGRVSGYKTAAVLAAPFGTTTHVVAAQDFDGDGGADLLLQNILSGERGVLVNIAPGFVGRFKGYGNLASDLTEVAAGRFDGGRGAQVVLYSQANRRWEISSLNTTAMDRGWWDRRHPGWAVFPERCTADSAVVGDFDGDQRTDLLVSCVGVLGHWVVFSNPDERAATGVTGLRQTVWIPQRAVPRESTTLVAGDFAGIGRDEVIELPGADGAGELRALTLFSLESRVSSREQQRSENEAAGLWRARPCIGFRPTSVGPGGWGRIALGECPSHYALLGVDDIGTRSGPRRITSGECCPLPDTDILTSERSVAGDECPASAVATGFEMKDDVQRLVCTHINDQRYQLGPATSGVHWGVSLSMQEPDRCVERDKVPLGFRYALGRQGYSNWDVDGCIGLPWGSLLVAQGRGLCGSQRFRELQYKGRAGDPVAGTPVALFPPCAAIDNIFSSSARCEGETSAP